MLTALRTAADALLTVLLAPGCASCAAPLDAPLESVVCSNCWSAVVPITPPVCEACGDPLPTWREASLHAQRCSRCLHRVGHVRVARAVGAYDGTLRSIVHAFKYDGRRSLAAPLGALIRRAAQELLDGADAVVPVPLHRSRRRQRGFNQASDLARHLGVPVQDALKRVRRTATQTELPETRRQTNVRGAFRLRRFADVGGLVLVLVDDVSTTGATLEACARVLVEAGAREVRAVTAAKAVSRRP